MIFILGFGSACVFIPQIPEYIDILNDIYVKYDSDVIGDIGSALSGANFNLAELIGPLLGGGMANALGF